MKARLVILALVAALACLCLSGCMGEMIEESVEDNELSSFVVGEGMDDEDDDRDEMLNGAFDNDNDNDEVFEEAFDNDDDNDFDDD